MPQLKTAILLTNLSVYQFNQRLWDFKVDCLEHNLYLFCTILTCLSFFCNVSHINYLSKYTRGKNLIWANRSFHKSIFIWSSFDSNRHFLRAFKYIALTLQFYKFMNVVRWVTWNCPVKHFHALFHRHVLYSKKALWIFVNFFFIATQKIPIQFIFSFKNDFTLVLCNKSMNF